MSEYLFESYLRYPLMRVQDFVKQIYQAEFGCEHLINANADSRIQEELLSVFDSNVDVKPFDEISADLARINLRPFRQNGYPTETLVEIMKKTVKNGTAEGMNKRLQQFSQMVGKRIDLPVFSTRRFISTYKAKGFGPISHSAAYRLNYHPHYRIADKRLAVLLPLIAKIDEMLYRKLNVVVAIDGPCGSGKSFYAEVLRQYYDCTVIACDDFFLPKDMRTPQRLNQVGGNIHYERLAQTLEKIKQDKPFTYGKYNCKTESLTSVTVQPKRLIIVEGSYSLHPTLRNFYDITTLLGVGEVQQRQRLLLREGIEGFANYEHKWIPLEKVYFESLDKSDCIYIDTDSISYS